MILSIVTTLYKSSSYIYEFYERISQEAQKITDDYEIIFVDDGSPDDSLEKAVDLYKKDDKVKVIELSRNFGHHKAIMTGLSHASGDYVFLIDADLEEEPELLGDFWNKLTSNNKLDVVYGVQQKRKGAWFERWSGDFFYKTVNFLSENKITKNFLTVRLMRSNFVNNLVSFRENELNFSTLITLNGFESQSVIIKKLSHSETSYTFSKKLSIFVNTITSSTARPLWLIFYSGLLITSFSVLFIFKLLFDKIFYNISVDGWTSLILSVWFFGGIIIFFLGILGIYLSKIFIETKHRPYTIIKKVYKDQI